MKLTTEGWQGYTDFLMCFRELNNEEFSTVTRNYRDSNQHRYPPRVEMGHTEFVTRNRKDKNNMYAITSKEPLRILDILPFLLKQYDISMNCYKLYDKIICNQLVQMHSNLAKQLNVFLHIK